MKFQIGMFNESYDENGNLIEKKKEDILVEADSCCEACVRALKMKPGYSVYSWKCLDKAKKSEIIPENKHEKEALERLKKMKKNDSVKKE